MDEQTSALKKAGLMDPRMGTIDRNFKCKTCGEGMSECPGHFGHIELTRPVFHYGYLTKVKKILECVCFFCSKLKVNPRNPALAKLRLIKDPKARLAIIWNITKTKSVCDNGLGSEKSKKDSENKSDLLDSEDHGCGRKQPLIRKEQLKLYAVFKQTKKDTEESLQYEGKVALTPMQVQQIFKRIKDEDLITMGLSPKYARPEWLIINVLPVPPPAVRPSIQMDATGRSEDDLTHKLSDIIKSNLSLSNCETEGAPVHIIDEFEQLLQYHIATYMDNDIAGLPQALQKSGRPLKSIRARLKGKEGRLRGNLMGKRVDFSARTVITGDPNLSIDQVGVPKSIAKNLTYPEIVTEFNIQKLQQLVKNGPEIHPGAKYIIKKNGERIDLRYARRGHDFPLQIGYIVERHLNDGDVVIFNRQPSLHKMSMMGHRIKVMQYSTFRLNLSVTSPYNADFDGDEMNLHVPQSEESRAEILNICLVPNNIISPQSNKPVMGIVQDTLCGVRKFTKRDVFLDYKFVMNVVTLLPNFDGYVPPPVIVKPKPLWTGKQILSLVIPKGINCIAYHSAHPDSETTEVSPGDTRVLIQDGDLLTGIVCKKTVGASSGGLIHTISNEKGNEIAKLFINGCQTVVNYWLLQNGFSIGIGDTIADPVTMGQITSTIEVAKLRVKEVINDAYEDKLECQPGMTYRESFENRVNRELNTARDNAGTTAQSGLSESNNVKQMVIAGSKGSFINISQMSACVGQQNVEGKRIPFGFKDRSLPHFLKGDYSPESKGFVENSYLRGLTPQEFFFHAMGGREGLIDTAVKTAETGYIQRRLVKALEDVMVKYDGTVRNSLGQVVQFCYGEDGMDAVHIEKQSIDLLKYNDDKFYKVYKFESLNKFGRFVLSDKEFSVEVLSEIEREIEANRIINREFNQLVDDRNLLKTFIFPNGESNWPLPVNIKRMIWNAKILYPHKLSDKIKLNPVEVVKKIERLCEKIVVIRGDNEISKEANLNATLLFKILIRSYLSSKRCTLEFRLSNEAFDYLLENIERKYKRSECSPGEMVGTLAAQSIGEPATQMTLNTFHYAGVSSKNVTLGVPRLKEIINVATNIKTPSLTVYLNEEHSSSIQNAKKVQVLLEHCTLKNITASTSIIYDPDPSDTVVEYDKEFVRTYFEIPDEDVSFSSLSPWVLRLELNRKMVLDKNLTMEEIRRQITTRFGKEIMCIGNDDNSEKLVLRCRVVNDEVMAGSLLDKEENEENMDERKLEEDLFLRKIENDMLNNVSLRGIKGINRVYIVEKKNTKLDEKGDFISQNEWVLETDGSNLKRVLCLDNVDSTRTYSNNGVEIIEVLGIEAARRAILYELRNVIEFDGSYVNYRHLSMLCDVMTTKGHLMAITRHGINRAETGVLMRCSFEETVEILLEAAAIGQLDECKGVAENVILGQLAPLGTGEFELYLDDTQLKNVSVNKKAMEATSTTLEEQNAFVPYQSYSTSSMTPYDTKSPQYASFSIPGSPAGVAFTPFSPTNNDSNQILFDSSHQFSPNPVYSPTGAAQTTSLAFSPGTPSYSPTTGLENNAEPEYSPMSPSVSVMSPSHRAVSPSAGNTGKDYQPPQTNFSPSSPTYKAQSYSPAQGNINPMRASPNSPSYSPMSPGRFTAVSPGINNPFGAGGMSGTTIGYSPSSPSGFNMASPQNFQASPSFSPVSPAVQNSVNSPAFSSYVGPGGFMPASPAFGNNTGLGSTMSPRIDNNQSYIPGLASTSISSPSFSMPYDPESNAKKNNDDSESSSSDD